MRTIFVTLIVSLLSSSAFADDVPGASRAFSEAQKASLAGDKARAAEFYELADSLAPSIQALRSAARFREAANHKAMAATHAEALIRRYPDDKKSVALAKKLLKKLSGELARVSVSCTELCTLTVDGSEVAAAPSAKHIVYLRPGRREIDSVFSDSRTAKRKLTARKGQSFEVNFSPPIPKQKPIAPTLHVTSQSLAPQDGGLSRRWVIGGGVLTLGLAAGTIVMGMKTLDTRDAIVEGANMGLNTDAYYDDGVRQQKTTNILLSATLAVGVGTAALALWTNWSVEDHQLTIAPVRDGGTIVLSGHF